MSFEAPKPANKNERPASPELSERMSELDDLISQTRVQIAEYEARLESIRDTTSGEDIAMEQDVTIITGAIEGLVEATNDAARKLEGMRAEHEDPFVLEELRAVTESLAAKAHEVGLLVWPRSV